MTPPDPVSANIYDMDEKKRYENGIDSLPTDLYHAVREMEKDSFIRQVLGDHVYYKYIEAKDQEWRRFNTTVTQWELKEYLGKY